MFKLFRENVRIAFGSIRTQLLRTILTVLIIAHWHHCLGRDFNGSFGFRKYPFVRFCFDGSQYFQHQSIRKHLQKTWWRRKRNKNPIISYPEAVAFKNKYNYPLTGNFHSFTATSTAEIKFESDQKDPENKIVGVDEFFMVNLRLETVQGEILLDSTSKTTLILAS